MLVLATRAPVAATVLAAEVVATATGVVVLAAGVIVLAAGVIVLAEWFFAEVPLIIASSYVQIVRQYQVTQPSLLMLLA